MSVSAKSLKGVDKWGKMLMDVDINEISVPNNSVPELYAKATTTAKIYVSSSGLEDAAFNHFIKARHVYGRQVEVALYMYIYSYSKWTRLLKIFIL